MVVNGSSSKRSPVLSRVPQGTVLGPSLFPRFVNDLPSSVSSRVKLFADDSMLYRHIESSADHDKLQQDLLQLEEWAAMWQMNFAPSKCYIMSITLKGRTIRKRMGWGGGRAKYKKKSCKGKLNEKNSWTPINPKKYSCYGLKKSIQGI